MDKIRSFLTFLKNYHFWMLALVVLVLGLFGWFSTAGKLIQQFSSNKSTVDQAFQDASNVQSVSNHPNDGFDEGMQKLIRSRGENVRQAWDLKWQRQGDILVWPSELQSDFINRVKSMRLIEEVDPDDPKQQLRISLRERYRDYIKNELPKLADMIQAKWTGDTSSSETGEMSGVGFGLRPRTNTPPRTPSTGDQPEAEAGVIVQWNSQNQAEIQSKRFDWSYLPEKAPSTLQVLYAQEDLWVLKALMMIIKKTNGHVESRHMAAIKGIEFIHIGKDVAGPIGHVFRVQSQGGEDDAVRATSGNVAEASADMGIGEFGADLGDGRYVDKNYKPLAAAKLREAMKSQEPADAYLAVAKRVPVRMRLIMDSRKINKLLVECGNSPLTVEVRQVRVNPPTDTSSSVFATPRGAATADGGGGLTTGQGGNPADVAGPFDVPVEIYGIVYIFNPVDPSKLHLEDEALAAQRPQVFLQISALFRRRS